MPAIFGIVMGGTDMDEKKKQRQTCQMLRYEYYPCAEDDCMRLKIAVWICSECEYDHFGNKPNYCPNCGTRVVNE